MSASRFARRRASGTSGPFGTSGASGPSGASGASARPGPSGADAAARPARDTAPAAPAARSARRTGLRAASAVAALALAVPALSACGAVETALDCAQTATAIGQDVDQLQQAFSGGADNPTEARQALNKIDKNLDELGDKTDNADMSKAVNDLTRGVNNAQEAIDQGKTPDTAPIQSAASELTKICTPG